MNFRSRWLIFLIMLLVGVFSVTSLVSASGSYIFVNELHDSYYTGDGFKGGKLGGSLKQKINPNTILGSSENQVLCLSTSNYVVVGVKDNYITDIPGAEIYVREDNDGGGETASVYVGDEDNNFVLVGKAASGKVSQFDISQVRLNKPIRWIKISGNDSNGSWPGFDLVSVKVASAALRTIPSVSYYAGNDIKLVNIFPKSINSINGVTLQYRDQNGKYENLGNPSPYQFLLSSKNDKYPHIQLKTSSQFGRVFVMDSSKVFVRPSINNTGNKRDAVIRLDLDDTKKEVGISGLVGRDNNGSMRFYIYKGEGNYQKPLWEARNSGDFSLKIQYSKGEDLYLAVDAESSDQGDLGYWKDVTFTYEPGYSYSVLSKDVYDYNYNDALFLPSNAFNYELAKLSLKFVQYGYLENSQLDKEEISNKYGFNDVQLVNIPGTDTQVLVGWKEIRVKDQVKRVIAISFRGTTTLDDWVRDAYAGQDFFGQSAIYQQVGSNWAEVHTGFYEAVNSFEEVEEEIIFPHYNCLFNSYSSSASLTSSLLESISRSASPRSAMNNVDNIYWISGHSLGGALATIYSTRLVDRGVAPQNIVTYTFAAPPVGNQLYCDQYDKKINLHRIANADDIVPNIGSFIKSKTGFSIALRHMGYPYEFKPDRYFHIQYNSITPNGIYNGKDAANAHSLDAYYCGIEQIKMQLLKY